MSKVLIIAEAGVNHNGDIKIAKELCLKAKEIGADIIKFQTWITEKIITRDVAQADYQAENTKNNQSQFDMLKALELSFDQFKEIKNYWHPFATDIPQIWYISYFSRSKFNKRNT